MFDDGRNIIFHMFCDIPMVLNSQNSRQCSRWVLQKGHVLIWCWRRSMFVDQKKRDS